MDNRFDDPTRNHDTMYESPESRYATELVNVAADKISKGAPQIAVNFNGVGDDALVNYLPGSSAIYVIDATGKRQAIALQDAKGAWMGGSDIFIKVDGAADGYVKVEAVVDASGVVTCNLAFKVTDGSAYAPISADLLDKLVFAAIGRYDSEKDLTGKYLGEVELQMRDYHFRPRPITLGVTWTELTELVLDTSFGVSAEEMLMDSAAQEIKKTLDFQAVKYASDTQKVYANENFTKFDAGYASGNPGTKDSYWHQAQLVNQAIGRIEDNMLNAFMRGGVTAIVGGPKACRYLELNESWSNKGAQPKIGGHKVGELAGIPVFKVPSSIIPDNQLLTTWKNDQAEGDVSIAIGTLVPFYSTGALQRKHLYKEAAVARFEDTQALQPKYLGRIQIDNIQ